MNPIELVTALPNWRWAKHSQDEITLTGQELVDATDFVWRIGNVAVAGFVHHSFCAPPWMWFVLADDISIADLIDFRRLALRIPRGTTTAVLSTFAVGLKFAKVYGFVETGEEVAWADRSFRIMRKS